MKPFGKGLASLYDVLPTDMLEGMYPYGFNGVFSDKQGTVSSEYGFTELITFPGKVIGVIESSRFPVVFVKNETTGVCYIGLADTKTNTYDIRVNDSTLPFKLPFDVDWFIMGEAEHNYNNELCVAFTDRKGFPMYVNLDKPDLTKLDDLNLYPVYNPVTLSLVAEVGGAIDAGAYYVAAKLSKQDGTSTGYIALSDVIIIPGSKDEIQDAAVRANLSGLDTAYDYVTICVVKKKSGILTCSEMAEVQIPASGVVTILYSGEQITTAITIEEVLVPRKTYIRADAMGQLNGSLYLMGVDDEPEVDMQKYANLIKVEFVSKLFDAAHPNPVHTSGQERSFTHNEVVSLYVQYERKSGALTKAFTIPGQLPVSGDTAAVTLPDGTSGFAYQVQDRIHSFDVGTKTGTPGVWINLDETYPDIPSFDSSAIGGQNLRGQPVLHHRMPSINWCKANLYSTVADYGRSVLDMLGIRISNIVIPTALAGDLTGRYVIHFGRKSVINMTVLGQSILLYGAKANNGNYVSTGGNFNSRYDMRRDNPGTLTINPEVVRFHAFDMLVNKPQTSPDYLQTELKMGITNIAYTPDIYFEDQSRDGYTNKCSIMGYKMDYINDGNLPVAERHQVRVRNRVYVPNNMVLDRYENTNLESFIALKTDGSLLIPATEGQLVAVHQDRTAPANAVKQENTFLTTAMVIRRNCYAPYTSQSLVRMGSGVGTTTFFNGDTFINDYTFHTYGWFSPEDSYNNTDGVRNTQGTRTIRRFVCEGAANLWARYETISNKYSYYYPKHGIKYQDPTNYITDFLSTEDPNQFAYSKDSNALNDLLPATVWTVAASDMSTVHPFRIHRNGKMDRTSKKRSWRTSLPLDFYELQKNMGLPQRVYGMDDRLIILHENAMYLTQDKTKLDSDLLSITLGSGDIFQFEPQQKESAKLGYAGTQHRLACVHTPEGFVFLDAKSGRMFLYKGDLYPMANLLGNFFRAFLRMKEENVFQGNGYTIGYDPEYARIMLSAKDVRIVDNAGDIKVYKTYEDTEAFLNSLTTGDIVYKSGKYLTYQGKYNGTQPYDCPALPTPTCTNKSASLTLVTQGTIAYTLNLTEYNAKEFYITGGNDDKLFNLSPEGLLTFAIKPLGNSSRVLTVKALNGANYCNFTITITWTVQRQPNLYGFNNTIGDGTPGGTVLGTVVSDTVATAFTIVEPAGAPFIVVQMTDTTAEIRTSGPVSYEDGHEYALVISATTADGTPLADVNIVVTDVNEAPTGTAQTVSILDTTPINTVIVFNDFTDPERQELTLTVISESSPGKLQLTPSGDIKLAATAVGGSQYTMRVRATDPGGLSAEILITVNVLFDPRYISFRPASVLCSAVCSSGYTPTPDGSQCIRILTEPSVPPTAPAAVGVAVRRREIAYNNLGMRIYKPAEFNADGTPIHGAGTSYTLVNTGTFWKNSFTTANGRLNNCGLWRKETCVSTPWLDTAWEYIGFSKTITLTAAKTVYIGMSMDNIGKVKINGSNFIVQPGTDTVGPIDAPTNNFDYWHIYPVALAAGSHIIELLALNQGSVAIMGLEIYDNTEAEILAATNESMLNFIFSTKDMECQVFTNGITAGYSCATAGYALDASVDPPVCKKIEYTAPIGTPGTATIGSVQVIDTRDSAVIATFINDGTQRYFQGVAVPIYTALADSALCSGGTPLYYSAMKSNTARKNNCTSGVGSDVLYVVPNGKYYSTVAQSVADDAADADIAANTQAYANTHGTCQ